MTDLPTTKEIAAAWGAIEELDPDISTEQLFARVRDHFGGRIDNGDIAKALRITEAQKARKK